MLAAYNLSRLFYSWHLWLSKLIKLSKFTANLIRLSIQLNQLEVVSKPQIASKDKARGS